MKTFLLACACCLTLPTFASEVEVSAGKITLDFTGRTNYSTKSKYTIKRAVGRFGEYKVIGKTSKTVFTDKKAKGNPYDYYYCVLGAKGDTVALMAPDIELFGEEVIVYSPADNMEAVGQSVNGVHDKMFGKEMSPNRYALFFKPGDYTKAGLFQVPFYVHMAGLGKVPYDVKLHNVHTPPHLRNDNGTCTFWRSIENLSVLGPESYDHEEMFNWAVSQAAPIRRVYSQRTVRNQWKNGWVSGGFTADCVFEAPAGSDGQQQWFTRNSYLGKGRGKFREGAYNFVFSGVELGKSVDPAAYSDDWTKGSNITFMETTNAMREKPFLFIGEDGRYKVFRPALRRNTKGVSYTRDNMGEGETLDLLETFFIVKPGVSTAEMNRQLAAGKNLLFTPGMYDLDAPLHITRPNTIVMGIGWATIIPAANSEAAILIDDIDGVQVASILFDAHHSSEKLIRVGEPGASKSHKNNPTVLSDLFFRIGGFIAQKMYIPVAVEINSNDVIGDHFWIWRADHGVRGSVGWDINRSDYGLHVKGNDVTIYGLFNEHFQKYQTYWEGEGGKVYFYQCETPYDAPNQEVFMSENGTRPGYAAYKVADSVQTHEANGIGIYDVLHRDIMFYNSAEVPNHKGILVRHIVNTSFIPGDHKGFSYVLNGMEESTYKHPKQYVARIAEFRGTE